MRRRRATDASAPQSLDRGDRIAAHRLADAEIAREERVRPAERAHREVRRRPRADARQRHERGGRRLRIRAALELQRARGGGARQPEERFRPRARQPDRRDLAHARVRDTSRLGEAAHQSRVARPHERAEAFREPSRERRRARDRHLLPEHRAHRALESVERARHPQPRIAPERRLQQRVLPERARDHGRLRVEVEEPAQPHRDLHQRARERGRHAREERVTPVGAPHGDRARRASHADHAPVLALAHRLHARDGARTEELQQRVPRERRAVVQAQRDRVRGVGAALLPPDGAGIPPEAFREQRVEAAHTAEAAREGDVRERQSRVVEELLRERQPLRLRELDGRHPDRGLHRAAQVTGGHAELPRERVDRSFVQEPALDEPDRARHEPRQRVVVPRAGRDLRPAPEARAESRALRFRRGAVERAAVPPRRPRAADRPAVDARRRHAHEERAVEARVAREERLEAPVGVEHHAPDVAHPRTAVWPFSDMAANQSAGISNAAIR